MKFVRRFVQAVAPRVIVMSAALLLFVFAALFLIIWAQSVVIASKMRQVDTLRRYNHRLVRELLAKEETGLGPGPQERVQDTALTAVE